MNLLRYVMGSQLNCAKRDNEEIWDFLMALRQNRTALFWILCNFEIFDFEIPNKKPVAKIKLEGDEGMDKGVSSFDIE